MSIKDNFLVVKPTLLLDFMKSKRFDPRMTFTAGGVSTYTDAAGVLRSNVAGSPRINHRYNSSSGLYECAGLLIEESRQNLFPDSQNFNAVDWVRINSTVTNDTAVAPDGTQTADTFTQTGATTGYIEHTGFSFTSGRVYTFSCYLKKIDVSEMYVLFYGTNFNNGGANCFVTFNLDSVTSVTGSGSVTNHGIEDVGNGWRRIWASFTATTTATGSNQYLRFKDPGAASNVRIWGAQFEESTSGAFATSYIPTSGATATRNTEVSNILTLSPWFNTAEGTLVAEFDSYDFGTGRFPRIACLVDSGGQTNLFQAILSGQTETFYASAWDNGSTLAGNTPSSYADRRKSRIAFTYDSAVFRGSSNANAASGGSINSTLTSEFNRLSIGHLTSGGLLNGHIHSIAYYPKKFSDTLLVEATRV